MSDNTQDTRRGGLRLALQILLPLVVVVIGVGAAMALISSFSKPERVERPVVAPAIRVAIAERADRVLTVRTQGTVQPRTQSSLISEVSGRVTWVSPSLVSGGFFEKNDVLLRLDAVDYHQAAATAASNVAQAKLALASEEASAEVAREEWEELGDGPGTPLSLRELQVEQARATLEAAEAALERAQRDLSRTEVRAPFAGRVRQKLVDLGQFVARGTPTATIYSIDIAEIRLPIPDDQLAYLELPLSFRGSKTKTRPKVDLSADFAGKNHHWEGVIDRTEGEIDPRTRMVYAVAQVMNPYGRKGKRPPLAVGMFVQADIDGRLAEDVVVLPRAALRGEDQVLVVDGENKLRFREVQIKRLDREQVVISSGLENGERVCLTPLDTVTDGMLVEPTLGEASDELAGVKPSAMEALQREERS